MTSRPGSAQPMPAVTRDRLDEMSCFLKRRMVQLRPDATFAPAQWGPPLEPVSMDAPDPGGGTAGNFFTTSITVIDDRCQCYITITVRRGQAGTAGIDHKGAMAIAVALSRTSTVVVLVEGGAISDEAALAIANAPELDLFR